LPRAATVAGYRVLTARVPLPPGALVLSAPVQREVLWAMSLPCRSWGSARCPDPMGPGL